MFSKFKKMLLKLNMPLAIMIIGVIEFSMDGNLYFETLKRVEQNVELKYIRLKELVQYYFKAHQLSNYSLIGMMVVVLGFTTICLLFLSILEYKSR